jgi:hypothetical protein
METHNAENQRKAHPKEEERKLFLILIVNAFV